MPYKISKVVFIKTSEVSETHFGYIEITGPRGGKYILDEFNTEVLCLIATDGYSHGIKASAIMARYGREKEIFSYSKDELNTVKYMNDKLAGTLLSKFSGKKQAMLIAMDLPDKDKELLEKHTQGVMDDKLTQYMQRNRR